MTLLFTDPRFLEHETGAHPECADRLRAVSARLEASGLLAEVAQGDVHAAKLEAIERVHSASYVEEVCAFARAGGGRIEADTVVSSGSYDAALCAAGSALAAVDAVVEGTHPNALCLVRPPGHHALENAAMGFCLFNNVAIAARHALAAHGLERVLIVDWDVHHGNGTQDAFDRDGQVHFFSAHRYPFYPGTGAADETGAGDGLGTIWNLPLAFGISRDEYHAQFERMLSDAAARCRPELVLISAGFDAHARDPIGSLGLESEDFGILTDRGVEVANEHCQGRVVSLLEGGYNVDALAESVELHLSRLMAAG